MNKPASPRLDAAQNWRGLVRGFFDAGVKGVNLR